MTATATAMRIFSSKRKLLMQPLEAALTASSPLTERRKLERGRMNRDETTRKIRRLGTRQLERRGRQDVTQSD